MLLYYFVLRVLFLNALISSSTEAVKVSCHREDKFLKVTPDGLPQISAIKVVTSSKAAFCMTSCFNHEGCESVVFHTTKSDSNCELSSEVNGASSGEPDTVTYVKEQKQDSMCDANPCEHDGTCIDMCQTPYYFCKCLRHTTGTHCDVNEWCSTSPCQNGGSCSTTTTSPYYQCQCPEPYDGSTCETNTGCSTSPCQNAGSCFTTTTSPYYQCQCPEPYEGSTCETNTGCSTSPCQNGGTCSTTTTSPYYQCQCPEPYDGSICETNTACSPSPCQNGGACSTTTTSPYYQCQCPDPVITGSTCETNNACSTSPCQNGGTCSTTSVSPYYQCQCPLTHSGIHCTERGLCSTNQCQNGGACYYQTTAPNYVCECPANHAGPNCQTVLSPTFTTPYMGCNSMYYTMITDGARHRNSAAGSVCDDVLTPGWYRISGAAGSSLAISMPNLDGSRCNTIATGYVVGGLPSAAEGVVTRKICFSFSGSSCAFQTEARALNCNSYYLFDLLAAHSCYIGYCTE